MKVNLTALGKRMFGAALLELQKKQLENVVAQHVEDLLQQNLTEARCAKARQVFEDHCKAIQTDPRKKSRSLCRFLYIIVASR